MGKSITDLSYGRVEEGRGGLGRAATPRFPSPLIKPDVRISRIRLSDWLHDEAFGAGLVTGLRGHDTHWGYGDMIHIARSLAL